MLVLQIAFGLLIIALAYNLFSPSTDKEEIFWYHWVALVVLVLLFILSFFAATPAPEAVETASLNFK